MKPWRGGRSPREAGPFRWVGSCACAWGVHADGKQNYVAIDDKLPAGLEPLNAALETTERIAKNPLTPAEKRSLDLLSYSEYPEHARVSRSTWTRMAAGDYEYSYVARATTPGSSPCAARGSGGGDVSPGDPRGHGHRQCEC